MLPLPQNWQNLTPRERQVATMICQGLTNHDVARILCISPETVKTHASNILHKLGYPRRSSLNAAYHNHDFTPAGDT